jgi:hypothetical protein
MTIAFPHLAQLATRRMATPSELGNGRIFDVREKSSKMRTQRDSGRSWFSGDLGRATDRDMERMGLVGDCQSFADFGEIDCRCFARLSEDWMQPHVRGVAFWLDVE